MKYNYRLKELREQAEMSQTDLCKALGDRYGEQYRISQNSISKYEQGQREPSLDFLLKVKDFFGVSMDYLLGVSDSKTLPRLSEANDLLKQLSSTDVDEVIKYMEYLKWRVDH